VTLDRVTAHLAPRVARTWMRAVSSPSSAAASSLSASMTRSFSGSAISASRNAIGSTAEPSGLYAKGLLLLDASAIVSGKTEDEGTREEGSRSPSAHSVTEQILVFATRSGGGSATAGGGVGAATANISAAHPREARRRRGKPSTSPPPLLPNAGAVEL